MLTNEHVYASSFACEFLYGSFDRLDSQHLQRGCVAELGMQSKMRWTRTSSSPVREVAHLLKPGASLSPHTPKGMQVILSADIEETISEKTLLLWIASLIACL